jgi:hypothetical protein
VQQEGAAADARGLGLHQAEHHLHRDRRIERRAAALQHIVARARGERIRGGDHELPRDERFARLGKPEREPAQERNEALHCTL